ncbi:MAG: C2H2-type zinc finger protein [Thaumarchaeota archaeon]|nr:C2H2-type zinc finger protein [Nitrososphaerota archaeon]
MHQCYYCSQIFDTKEKLYDHLEIHTDAERSSEIIARSKERAERAEARGEGGDESEASGETGGNRNRTVETE